MKATLKEEELKIGVSDLDTFKNTKLDTTAGIHRNTQKDAKIEAKQEKSEPLTTPEGNKRVKRAPKKSNQRVFLAKISKRQKQSENKGHSS